MAEERKGFRQTMREAKERADAKAAEARQLHEAEVRQQVESGKHAGVEYDAAVNKKSINMGALTATLNGRAANGWRLHTAFEQDGNTILIFERKLTA